MRCDDITGLMCSASSVVGVACHQHCPHVIPTSPGHPSSPVHVAHPVHVARMPHVDVGPTLGPHLQPSSMQPTSLPSHGAPCHHARYPLMPHRLPAVCATTLSMPPPPLCHHLCCLCAATPTTTSVPPPPCHHMPLCP